MTSTGSHASRGVKFTLLAQLIKGVFQLLSTVVLARLLVPADYGLYAIVISFTGFAVLLADFGLSAAAIQAKTLSDRQRSNLFWLNTGIGGALALVLVAVAGPIADFYGEPEVVGLIRAMSVTFLLLSMAAQFTAHLTRSMHFGKLAVIDVVSLGSGIGTAIIAGLLGAGAWALVFQQIVYATITLVMAVAMARWMPGLPGRAPMKPLIQFGVNAFGVQALSFATANVDSIVLGRTAGATQLGFYDRAFQLFKIPVQQLAAPLTRVALPVLSRIQGDGPGFTRAVTIAQLAVSYGIGAVFVLGGALAEPTVEILLGSPWLPAAPLFSILAIGGVFQAMGYVYYWVFLAKGLTALQLRYSVITRSAMVALILLGAFGGVVGVAVAVSASLFLNWLILSLFPLKQAEIDTRRVVLTGLRATAVNVSVAVVVAVIDRLFFMQWGPWPRLAIGLGVAALLYTLCVFAVPVVRRDFRTLVNAARSR